MQLTVEGMTCGHCRSTIVRAIEAIGGTATVDLARRTVVVDGVADPAAAVGAIEAAGYRVVARQGVDTVEAPSGCCGGCHA